MLLECKIDLLENLKMSNEITIMKSIIPCLLLVYAFYPYYTCSTKQEQEEGILHNNQTNESFDKYVR